MSSARAIGATLLLIGVTVYFISRVATMISYSTSTFKEIKLEDTYTAATKGEAFYLTNFYYTDKDYKMLDDAHSQIMPLYNNENDSIAKTGIEIHRKHLFLEDFKENGKIVVKAGGSLAQLPTRQGIKLFGYGYMTPEELASFRRQIGDDKFDEGIDRSIILEYIPHESFSRNWLELIGMPILIFGLLFIAIISFKNARRAGQF